MLRNGVVHIDFFPHIKCQNVSRITLDDFTFFECDDGINLGLTLLVNFPKVVNVDLLSFASCFSFINDKLGIKFSEESMKLEKNKIKIVL